MRFIKRTKLAFREGNSDKVYEVDLCEQVNDSEQRFLVNFRYGRRGTALKEGTKTPIPLSYQQAEDVFNSLVVAKTNKGYVDASALAPQPPKPSVSKPFDLAGQLDLIDEEKDSICRARLIWRLKQQSAPEIASRLIQGWRKSTWQEDYSRLWVIGQTGDISHAQTIVPYLDSDDSRLAALALEVLLKLGHEEANQIKRAAIDALPSELVRIINDNDSIAIANELTAYLTNKTIDCNSLLKTLYVFALDSSALHRALVELMKTLPIKAGYFKGIRYLFKMAEFRFDSAMFAVLSYRFDTTRQNFASDWYWNYSHRSQPSRLHKELAKPNCSVAFSDRTRNYLRRRSWRTLKRLGVKDDDRYATLAADLLLLFSEKDKQPEKSRTAYSWQDRKNVTVDYDGYAGYLVLNEILRFNSHQFKRGANRLNWIKVSLEQDNYRTEAFPAIWDRHPDALLNLLINSRADIVGEFAARALKENQTYCTNITDEQLYRLLMSSLSVAIEFAVDLLQKRDISHALLIQLIKSGNEKAWAIAFNTLNKITDVFAYPELVVSLLLIDNSELQDWFAQQCQKHAFSYSDNVLLEKLTGQLLLPDSALSESHAHWLAAIFIHNMESAVRDFSVEKISALFATENKGVQLFAATLLNANRIAFRDIPQSLLQQINQSDSSAIRAMGIALFGKTSDYELLSQLPLLVEISYRGEKEERRACFEILAKLSKIYSQQVFDQLLPLVFKKEQQDGQQDELFAFINQYLVQERDRLDKDTVWRLIQASATAAQRLGGEILGHYDMTAFTVKQWVILADNPNRNVRAYAQQAFERHVGLVKENSRNAIRLLECRWQDSQDFAVAFFNRHYTETDWTVELIISVCDSNLLDVQAYGYDLLQTYFKQEHGQDYLQKLSQHPSIHIQALVAQLLNDYAAGKPEIILSLRHYFISVLSQINKGRVSKDCVLAFLIQQADCSPTVLTMVTELFTRLSLTLVHKDKAQLIKAMLALKKQHPDLALPIEPQRVRVLTAVQGENYAS